MATSRRAGYSGAMRFLVVISFACALLVGADAQAQLDPCAPQQSSLRGFDVLPSQGATGVPVNATPFVTGADLELRLVGPDGNDVPTTIEDMLVLGSFGLQTTVRRLVPAGDLSPGETITIIADGSVRSTFTVGDAADGDAPAVPDAVVDGVSEGVNASACGPIQSSVTVGVAAEDAVLFVGVVNGQPALGAGVRLDGASTTDELVLFTEGAVEVNVAAVDLAGNVSASVPVNVDVPKVPPGFFACASSRSSSSEGGASLLALSLLAGCALRVGRRANSSRHVLRIREAR
jgi:hypothetical protein